MVVFADVADVVRLQQTVSVRREQPCLLKLDFSSVSLRCDFLGCGMPRAFSENIMLISLVPHETIVGEGQSLDSLRVLI